MSTIFVVAERLNAGLVRLGLPRVRPELWVRGRLRKRCLCWSCAGEYMPGEEMFRPLGNGLVRMRRVCPRCVDEAIMLRRSK